MAAKKPHKKTASRKGKQKKTSKPLKKKATILKKKAKPVPKGSLKGFGTKAKPVQRKPAKATSRANKVVKKIGKTLVGKKAKVKTKSQPFVKEKIKAKKVADLAETAAPEVVEEPELDLTGGEVVEEIQSFKDKIKKYK